MISFFLSWEIAVGKVLAFWFLFSERKSVFVCVCLKRWPLKRRPKALSYMVSGTRDNPPPETTLSSVYMWKWFSYWPNQSWSCMIIHKTYSTIKCAEVPLSLCFSRSFDHNKIYFLSPLFKHSVTLATQRVVPVREAKVFVWKKLPCLPGLPYLPRGGNSSTLVVSPTETTRGHWYKRLRKFYNDTRKVNSLRVIRGGGLCRLPETM